MIKEKIIKIHKTKIEEGIAISLKKSTEHLDAAELLINNNFLNDAVDLIEYAIEEIGRAVYLRERLQKGSEAIEKSLETNHKLKYDKAFSVLPTELKTIWEETISSYWGGSYWPKGYWGGGYWGESIRKETISPSTRLDAIFVSFDEKTQTWQNGIKADSKKLKIVVDKLRENIETFKW